jgi:hypothetical protein
LHAALGVRPEVAFSARGEAGSAHGEEASGASVTVSPVAGDQKESAGAVPEGAADLIDEPLTDVDEDPIELVKKGFAAQVVEEKNS